MNLQREIPATFNYGIKPTSNTQTHFYSTNNQHRDNPSQNFSKKNIKQTLSSNNKQRSSSVSKKNSSSNNKTAKPKHNAAQSKFTGNGQNRSSSTSN